MNIGRKPIVFRLLFESKSLDYNIKLVKSNSKNLETAYITRKLPVSQKNYKI